MNHHQNNLPHDDHGSSCPRTVGFDSDAPAAAGRRAFLRATGLVGAGLAVLGAGSTTTAAAAAADGPADATADAFGAPAAADDGRGAWDPDPDGPRFSLAVMPDTQYLFDDDRIHPAPLEASLRHVLDGSDENFVFLAHLGDVTQNGKAEEFAAAGKAFTLLDRHGAAYSVLAGNHDVGSGGDDQRGRTAYLDTFNPARFARSATFKGASPDGYNTYHLFRGAGRDWMVLSLDWRLSDRGFAWANSVIAQHPTVPVILTTHDLAYADDGGAAQLSDHGHALWDRLISGNDQIFLTLNGHYWPPGSTTLTNKAGHDVHVHITNYQNRYYGGAAMIRAYRFDLDRNTIDVRTYSPWIQQLAAEKVNRLASEEIELTGPVDSFSVQVDFARRFAGFAPVPARPARPARQLTIPGTVAYWRFDGGRPDGSAVADSQVVKDLSGHGNDLVKQTAPGSPAGTLTWSAESHPDQPGRGSLYFAGRGKPVQGAYLQTVAKAPMNADTFQQGYTFEAFFKLPADWDAGRNAWTALLSRWGTSGEAGKSGPDTDPQEPVATLSLSGGRELQWCVYPTNLSGPVTNWGHELPLGAWWHVAVVNNKRLTRMYVNGCEVVRNPSTPSEGLSTLGHPWLLGGYEYGGALNQVFHGWIGDVRVVNRPLPVRDFMIS
ncbi:LamG-like jellyroll fold domain-containing protein [Kitasatospora sp. NPDC059803]|uniref:LamG-like jellyroll fold domain-containing protein n=1 Tax=Kitasatospora sp. NPDC059803 TaxID=3346953 RepID=UPI00365DC2CE